MRDRRLLPTLLCLALLPAIADAQAPARRDDVTTPLHALTPDYPVPYGPITPEAVAAVLQRLHAYIDANTPTSWVDAAGQPVADPAKATGPVTPKPGAFRLTSYEWGVTYSGMLRASETTGDPRYAAYVAERLKVIETWVELHQAQPAGTRVPPVLRSVLDPRALDDAGAISAAMIRATRANVASGLRPRIDHYLEFITKKEFRFADGTLARNRPQANTLWLDDLYMSVPALSQAGALTGEQRYFDDAVKQVQQFSARMFNRSLGLYMHGWVEGMQPHPEVRWARANGWAIIAMADLLDVLPETHPGRAAVLEQFRAHAQGLAQQQSGSGFWHQLLDRTDSYLETSATAMYAYAFAHGINRGWLDPVAYGPPALLAWHAVSTKVNAEGQVEGTCVGTGMAFDPAFYYHRPTNVFAAHGYGPTLLAGAEVIELLKRYRIEMNDSSLQFYTKK